MTSDAYRTVLQMTGKLSLEEQLQLIEDLAAFIRHRIKDKPLHNIMEFEGIAKEAWEGVDVEKYIDEERNSWDR